MRPNIIILEGIDGCGKSTVCETLNSTLRADGLRVKRVINPTPDLYPFNSSLRDALRENVIKDPLTRLYLFAASHAAIAKEIHDSLHDYDVIILDRWVYSTLAYQVLELDIFPNKSAVHVAVRDILAPLRLPIELASVTALLLRVPPQQVAAIMERSKKRGHAGYDTDMDFLKALTWQYDVEVISQSRANPSLRSLSPSLYEKNTPLLKVVDAVGTADEVFARVVTELPVPLAVRAQNGLATLRSAKTASDERMVP